MEDVGNQGALQHGVQADSAGAAAQQAQQTPPAQQQQQQHAGEQQHQQHQHRQQHHEALERRDAQIQVLQKKLEHYRSWLSSLQGQMQHKDPQVLKNARRLYIGGIPEGAREAELRTFFDSVMDSTGASCGPGSSIITCKISPDKSYAFLEMRSVEEASNAMAFDGVVFKDTNLKIRRPSNYSSSEAVALGPVTPDPTINTDGLPMCKTVVEDTWNKIFIGGLPCHYTDDEVKELLAPYGALKSFNLVMDKNTGKSKGYAFCEFADQRSIPEVIRGLHMHTLERKVLTVKRALEGVRQGGGSVTGGAGGAGGGRLSAATPLGGTSSGALMHSSSGSSRAGSGMHPPPPPAAAAAMRSGSYSSGSQQHQGGGGGGGRYSGRGGSGSPSPMHSTMHGGERRFSPHHPQHSGSMGSPGGHSGDPFGGPPGGAHPHHMMTHPPGGPHPGGPGFGMGFYMAGEPPGGMFAGPGVMPPPGPLHGWPTHGVFAPTGGARAQRGGFEGGSGQWSHHHQQQQHQRAGGGGGPSRGSASYPSGGRQHSAAAAAEGNGGGNGGGNTSQSPATPSPVPPTPGSTPDSRPSTLSPSATAGGAGGSGELGGGAGSSSGGGATSAGAGSHRGSAAGSSSLHGPQHSSSMGISTRQRPSDAGSSHNPDASH